jgi:lysophospholipase L1-like esterase
MRTILCYGDSNTWGCPPILEWPIAGIERYGPGSRWGGVLRSELGEGFEVVEEGLGGRTTVWDDPIDGEEKNGKRYLLPCLQSHCPIDLVALMLGTNDLKSRFGLSPADVAAGVGTLVNAILASGAGRGGASPAVLVICPPPIRRMMVLADIFAGAEEKSIDLAARLRKVAGELGASFLDSGEVAETSAGDGIHLEAGEQRKLGLAVAAQIRRILNAPSPNGN